MTKHLVRFVKSGQTGEKSFKLETAREGDFDPQSREEVVAWTNKQRAQGEVDWRDLKASKMGWKPAHPKYTHTNKDMKRGLHACESSHNLSVKSS